MGQKPISNPSFTANQGVSKQQSEPQNIKPSQQPKRTDNASTTKASPKQNSTNKSPYGPLLGLIPRHIYNPDTKKILGIMSSEDLLLIALIFLFLESSDDDNPLMVLALVYVLLGDYIDFGDFAI